jgi:cation diffusion facilitator CzcD-associated flavoprotein CzcO
MKKVLRKQLVEELGKEFDIDKHFTPRYNPWDERLCLVPNGDLFEAMRTKKATVVTDHIECFTESGIKLISGEILEADIIITATGLNAQLFNNIDFDVDGEQVDFSKKVCYKSVMFDGIPNMTYAFGYTNASWTLKCDMTNQYTCRIINYMEENGYKQCMPVQQDPDLVLKPFLDFTPGYVMRVIDKLPKMGDKKPWKIEQNYFYDRKMFEDGSLEDGILVYK